MIRRKLLIASAIMVAVVTTACSDTTAPKDLASGSSAAVSSRSGTLHVEKDCSAYTGHAGDFCTLTSSSLKQIEAGSRVVYASDAVGTSLDTDVILDLPGPGNNTAFGHCTLSLGDGCWSVQLLGRNRQVHLVPCQGLVFSWYTLTHQRPQLAWDGTYSFSPGN